MYKNLHNMENHSREIELFNVLKNSQNAEEVKKLFDWKHKTGLSRIDVNWSNPLERDFTPVIVASIIGSIPLVDILIKNGADIRKGDNTGIRPLGWAAIKNNARLVIFLIQNGSDVNESNIDGNTPLMLAADRGNNYASEVLILNGADVNRTNNDGDTALHIASEKGHLLECKLLLRKGGDVNKMNNNGQTPLDLASNLEIKNLLIETLPLAQAYDISQAPVAAATILNNSAPESDSNMSHGNVGGGVKTRKTKTRKTRKTRFVQLYTAAHQLNNTV